MKAVRSHDFGGSVVLRYEDVEQPVPGAGQVRIRVLATSLHGLDVALRTGAARSSFPVRRPHTPGPDIAGTVDALGAGVENDDDGLQVGDAVVGFLPMDCDGGAAEYAIAPAEILAGVPRNVPLADAAALPLVGLTAWQALFEHGRIAAGQRVLVNGAGGAVGGYAVQLAKEARAHVIATTGPRSAGRVRTAGADAVIDRTTTDVLAAVTEPVDLVVNLAPVDPPQLAALLSLVRDGGRLVNTAVRVSAPSDAERGVRGVDLSVRSDADQLADLIARVCTGELVLDVAHRVALADLPALHARSGLEAPPGGVVVLAQRA